MTKPRVSDDKLQRRISSWLKWLTARRGGSRERLATIDEARYEATAEMIEEIHEMLRWLVKNTPERPDT